MPGGGICEFGALAVLDGVHKWFDWASPWPGPTHIKIADLTESEIKSSCSPADFGSAQLNLAKFRNTATFSITIR